MNKKQRFVVVVTLVLSALVGVVTAANAESLYLPSLSNYYIEIEAKYTVCGVPANGVEVYIDVFDGLDKIPVVTDSNGVARWRGVNNSTVVYIFSLGGERHLFQAFTKTVVSFSFCDGNLIIVPPPVSG